jgi:hypothetical protein
MRWLLKRTKSSRVALRQTPTPRTKLLILRTDLQRFPRRPTAGLKAVTAPLNVKLAEARASWNPLIVKADDHKDALNVKVLTPFLSAQKAKLEQERMAQEQAARDDNAPIPTTTRRGSNHQETAKVGSFGRTTHLRETWFVDITDRAKFLDHVKDYPGITDALEKIAGSFKTTRPEIPGLSYRKEDKAV